MRKKRLTEQQLNGFLKEAEVGMPVKELSSKHGISDAAFYGWRSKYGGLQVNEAKRLSKLEAENAKLKKPLAEAVVSTNSVKNLMLSNGSNHTGEDKSAFCRICVLTSVS